MKTIKYHSSVPYFFLVGLFGLIPVLNNKYPARFFPGFSPGGVEVLSTFAGIAAATLGFMRLWARLEKGARAKALVLEAAASRHPADQPLDNDLATVARFISRLVRNVDEDLREIGPDFSQNSLSRLEKFLPALLREIESREDALIRLGVAGVYLGEAACRLRHVMNESAVTLLGTCQLHSSTSRVIREATRLAPRPPRPFRPRAAKSAL